MTKPLIVVKMPCKLLYVIRVKEFLIKCSTSWPYLISEFLVAYIYITIVASDWPRTFLHPRCFCLASQFTDNQTDAFSPDATCSYVNLAMENVKLFALELQDVEYA